MRELYRKPIVHPYGYIYRTTNLVSGKKYIGKHHREEPTVDYNYLGSGLLIEKAINKHGKENFVLEVLDWAESKNELNELERYWIAYFNAVNSKDFYNLTHGGEGFGSGNENPNWNKEVSQETRTKISKSLKGRFSGDKNPMYGVRLPKELLGMYGRRHTRDSIEKMKKSHLGKKISKKNRESLDNWIKSPEHLKQLDNLHNDPDFSSKVSQGCKNSEKHHKHVLELNASKRIPVARCDLQGNILEIFESIAAASKAGWSNTGIQSCLKGKLKTSGKCIWKQL